MFVLLQRLIDILTIILRSSGSYAGPLLWAVTYSRYSGSYFIAPAPCVGQGSMCWATLTLSIQLGVSLALFSIEDGIAWNK